MKNIKFFLIVILSTLIGFDNYGYSKTFNDNNCFEDSISLTDIITKVDSSGLKIGDDTIEAVFNGFDENYYCRDTVAIFPVTFDPPSPLPAKRVFVKIAGNGITSTGKYSANFTPSVSGKYKVKYIVQDSILVQQPITVYQPIVRDSKGNITSGCDCNVIVDYTPVYQLSNEKVGYSSPEITVIGVNNFALPTSKCVSDGPLNLQPLVDPDFSSGQAGTAFAILSANKTYAPEAFDGATSTFDPSKITELTTFSIQYKFVSDLGCKDSVVKHLTVSTVAPAPPAYTATTLTKTNPCQYTPMNYRVVTDSNASVFIWSLPPGWTGSSSTRIINTTTSSTAGTIKVKASNACGTSTATDLAVTINAPPAAPGTITGATYPCINVASNYSITGVANTNSYTWTLPPSWSGSSAGTTISATPSSTAAAVYGTVSVVANNICGSSPSSSLGVVPNLTPVILDTIFGVKVLTQSTTNNPYHINDILNATSYNWSYSGTDYTFHNNGRNTTIDFSSTATSGDLSVTASNNCGTSTPKTLSIIVNPSVVDQPGEFTTSTTNICRGDTKTYTVPNNSSATYQWSYSGNGATITGTGNSVSIKFASAATTTSGLLSVKAVIGSVSSSPRTLDIDVRSTPAKPGTITGSSTPYQNTSTVYSIDAVDEANSYTWTTPSNWTGSSTSYSITTTPGSSSGNVTVTATNHCGTSAAATLAVVPGVRPTATAITGSTVVTEGVTGVSYSLSSTGATSYAWTYSDGGGIIIGSGSTVAVSFPVGTLSGLLSVVASNAYGEASAVSLNITVNTITAGIDAELTDKLSFSVAPNPFAEESVVRVTSANFSPITILVTDLLGHTRIVVENHSIIGYAEIPLPELSSGVYILTLLTEGRTYTKRIVSVK